MDRTVACKGGCGDLLRVDSIAVKQWGGYCDDCIIDQNIDIGLLDVSWSTERKGK